MYLLSDFFHCKHFGVVLTHSFCNVFGVSPLRESTQTILFKLFDLVLGFASIKCNCNKLMEGCMCKAYNLTEVIKGSICHLSTPMQRTDFRHNGCWIKSVLAYLLVRSVE